MSQGKYVLSLFLPAYRSRRDSLMQILVILVNSWPRNEGEELTETRDLPLSKNLASLTNQVSHRFLDHEHPLFLKGC
jgi:hypothetical protein